jgi:hypothetical protein
MSRFSWVGRSIYGFLIGLCLVIPMTIVGCLFILVGFLLPIILAVFPDRFVWEKDNEDTYTLKWRRRKEKEEWQSRFYE